MNISLKFKAITIFLKIVIYMITSGVLFLLMEEPNLKIIFPISIVVSFILSPRFTEVKLQSGRKTQMKWIFIKKPIFL